MPLLIIPRTESAKACAPVRAGQALLLALALSASPAGAANQVRLAFERLEHPEVRAEQMALTFVPAMAEQPPALRLQAATLRIDRLDRTLREVRFECAPEAVAAKPAAGDAAAATPAPIRWQCRGPLRWRGGQGSWQLAWQADEALSQAQITLAEGRSEITLHLPLGDSALVVEARRMSAAWLQPLLPQLQWQAGRIDGRIEQAKNAWQGRVHARTVSAQTGDGAIAFAGIELSGPLRMSTAANGALRIDAQPQLVAGELLAGPAYMAWPEGSAVDLDVVAASEGDDWRIEQFKLRDGDTEIDTQAQLRPAAEDWLTALSASWRIDLGSRYERYLEGAMASLGQAGLDAGGVVSGQIRLSSGGRIESLDSQLDKVGLTHPDGRYAIEGLRGELAFRRDREAAAAPVRLHWQRLALHAIEFDAGTLDATSAAGEIRASAPVRLGLFGGSLMLSDLVYRPLADRRDRLEASVALQDIDIARVAAAFDWPAFAGRLAGTLPQLRYDGSALTAGGEIAVQAFGGETRIAHLGIERPFGVAPAFAADIQFDHLDLTPLTEVFGFGRIEGRLNGRIGELRLLDWSPVAFDAQFRTAEGGRRRISQLAVEQLTKIGGGGGAAGIQGRLLGVFDSFGYRRIGLSCRLANNVCEMAGLDDAAGGYTILEGSGLPLITIRGFQRRVDWPVLVERLKAVIAGQAPVVD